VLLVAISGEEEQGEGEGREEGGITDLAIGRWLEEEGGRVVGFQLVKTKQIHKLMLTMFDPEEI